MRNPLIPRGTSIIAAVAQIPGGPYETFATLAPLAYLDGEQAFGEDFPPNGLIFWPVRQDMESTAQPGTIVIASLEGSTFVDSAPQSDRNLYRVQHDTLHEPDPSEVIEVIDYNHRTIEHPRDLLTVGDISLSHKPLREVFVTTPGAIYGPFLTTSSLTDSTSNSYSIVLRPASDKVAVIASNEFESISDSGLLLEIEAKVSLRHVPPYKSPAVVRCSYSLLCRPGIEALKRADMEFISIRTPEQVLQALTRKYLDRTKYQPAKSLFQEFVNNLGDQREDLTLEQTEVIRSIQTVLDNDHRLTRQLTDAIIDSGLLETNIEDRIKARAEQYITDNATDISAKIRQRVREVQLEKEALEKSKLALEAEIDARSRLAAQELESHRASVLAECQAEQLQLQAERIKLDVQRNELTKHLHDPQRYAKLTQ